MKPIVRLPKRQYKVLVDKWAASDKPDNEKKCYSENIYLDIKSYGYMETRDFLIVYNEEVAEYDKDKMIEGSIIKDNGRMFLRFPIQV